MKVDADFTPAEYELLHKIARRFQVRVSRGGFEEQRIEAIVAEEEIDLDVALMRKIMLATEPR